MQNEHLEKIKEFRRLFGQHIAESWREFDEVAARVQAKLIAEEYAELLAARTKEEFLDALGDLVYVVLGAAAATGVDINAPVYISGGETINALVESLQAKVPCYRRIQKYIIAALKSLKALADAAGVNLSQVFDIVHASNMTKVWRGDVRLTNVGPDAYVLKYNGKVIKPPTYTPPDLTKVEVLRLPRLPLQLEI